MLHEYPPGALVRVVDNGDLEERQRAYLGLRGEVVDEGDHETNLELGIRAVQFGDGVTLLMYTEKLAPAAAPVVAASPLTEDERAFAYSMLKQGNEVERVLEIIRTLRKGV